MKLRRLILREMSHRRLNVLLSVVGVLVAVGGVVGSSALLGLHDARTEDLVARKQRDTEQQVAEMEDQYRKITLKMGFNVLILPKDINLDDFHAENFAAHHLPENYADRLATSGVVTVQHLLPILQEKIKWTERQRTALLVGTRGEVAVPGADSKKPLIQPVTPGNVIVGFELHNSLGIKPGDTLRLLGRDFHVQACPPERGTKDDITIWAHLKDAQELLGRQGRISSIMALECACAMADLAKVREEIGRILPDTKVLELAGNALARAEARREAARNAELALAREKAGRQALRAEKERLFSVLVPIVVAGCAIWVGLLAYSNVRARRTEIGILRSQGLRASQILRLFLGKAALIGAAGAVAGILAGLLLAAGASGGATAPVWSAVRPGRLAATLLATPLLSALVSWVPALLASQQDPAAILQRE